MEELHLICPTHQNPSEMPTVAVVWNSATGDAYFACDIVHSAPRPSHPDENHFVVSIKAKDATYIAVRHGGITINFPDNMIKLQMGLGPNDDSRTEKPQGIKRRLPPPGLCL